MAEFKCRDGSWVEMAEESCAHKRDDLMKGIRDFDDVRDLIRPATGLSIPMRRRRISSLP